MYNKSMLKLLKDSLSQLEFAYGDLEVFVYYTDSDACSSIASNVNQQITYLKELISDLEE